jgi:hypothetical protein
MPQSEAAPGCHRPHRLNFFMLFPLGKSHAGLSLHDYYLQKAREAGKNSQVSEVYPVFQTALRETSARPSGSGDKLQV